MEFKKVTILGGGVLGTQIAMQSAYCGKDVTIWLRSEDSKTRTQPKLDRLYGVYETTLEQMNKTKAPADFCGGLASTGHSCLNSIQSHFVLSETVHDGVDG